jgi:hypothetical protein
LHGRNAWRCAAAAAGLAVATFGAVGTASADYVGRAPWCADMSNIDGSTFECNYYTYAQCAARASGISNVCYTNPYVEYIPERRPHRRHKHRHRY